MKIYKSLFCLVFVFYLTACNKAEFTGSVIDPEFPVPEKAELVSDEPNEDAKHIEQFAQYKQKDVQNGTSLNKEFEEEIKSKGWKEIKTNESPKIRGFKRGDKILYLTADRDNFELIKLKEDSQWLE